MTDCVECIEQRLKAETEAGEITCPACGYEFEHGEETHGHVTSYGEKGPQEDGCPSCNAALTITETVVRTYEVKLSGQTERNEDRKRQLGRHGG